MSPSNAHAAASAAPAASYATTSSPSHSRRAPRTGHARRVGRHPERFEHEPDHCRVSDLPEHAESAAAARAREHVDLEAPAEQGGPVDPRRCGVEHAAE